MLGRGWFSNWDNSVSMWTTRWSTWENGEGAWMLAAWPVHVDTYWAQKALGRDKYCSCYKRLYTKLVASFLKILIC